jgi:hypothetical protein
MTIVSYKQFKQRNQKYDFKSLVLLIFVILIIFTIAYNNQMQEKELLKNYGFSKAIVINSSYRNVYVKFTLNNKIIMSRGTGHYKFHYHLDRGDTILIKYSVEQPEIVEIDECFWNEKSKRKLQDFQTKKTND